MAIHDIPDYWIEDNGKPFKRLDLDNLPILRHKLSGELYTVDMFYTVFLLCEGQGILPKPRPGDQPLIYEKLVLSPYMVTNYTNYLQEIQDYVICKRSVFYGQNFYDNLNRNGKRMLGAVPPTDTASPFYPYWVKLQELKEFFSTEKKRTTVNKDSLVFNSSDIIKGSYSRETALISSVSFSKYFVYAIIAYFIFFKRKF